MKTRQEILESLITDPTLTHTWIDVATRIISENEDIDIDYLIGLGIDGQRMSMCFDLAPLFDGNIKNTLIFIKDQNYNETQLQVIIKAMNHKDAAEPLKLKDLDVFDASVPYAVMNYLLLGVIEGFEEFKDPAMKQYHPDQLANIYTALKDGVDIKDIMNPDISAAHMDIIRHARTIGLEVEYDNNNKVVVCK